MSDTDFTVQPGPLDWWTTHRGLSPILGTAIHNGHHVRDDIRSLMALSSEERLREEDPFTEFFIRDVPNRIIFHRSRFEIDLNRSREGAIYLQPEQAWGLDVWSRKPTAEALDASLNVHDAYYDMLAATLRGLERQYGSFVVLDIHSYNHRRNGPEADATDPQAAPQINIGTSSMDRGRWGPVVDAFMNAARDFRFNGKPLDVRENIAFQGKGEQTRFIHETFPETGCAIAIEFKKFFMDEWTGRPDTDALTAMRDMIRTTLPVLEDGLARR